MKGKVFKRFTAGLLALLMVFSLFYGDTTFVSAADNDSSQIVTQADETSDDPQGTDTSTAEAAKSDGYSEESTAASDIAQIEAAAASDAASDTLSETSPLAAASAVTGGDTITTGGEYSVTAGATGTITVTTTDKVTLIGNGGTAANAYSALSVDCTLAGSNLVIQNLAITSPASGANMFNFTGAGNTFTFGGSNLLECNTGVAGKAMIHVGVGTEVAIAGSDSASKLYFYKNEMAAGIGGNTAENNGAITINSGCIFGKGSKQGAVIGQGANTGSASTGGTITINGGVLNLIANARGALIGGSAGSSGASASGNVYVAGGTVSLNVDFSGAAIGGGGYATGNDASVGNLYISGGSVRTYIDENAVSSWSSYGVTARGVNDAAITAKKVDASGNNSVYMMTVDTSLLETPSSTYNVSIDGKAYYSGGLHTYKYINQELSQSNQTSVSNTADNWTADTDKNLYLYATGKDHVVTINGVDYGYLWDNDTKTFKLQTPTVTGKVTGGTSELPGGTITVSSTKPAAGDTITVSAAPAAGYYLAQVRYGDTRVAINAETTPDSFTYSALTASSSGTYSFTMTDTDITVYADFVSTVWDGTIDISWYNPDAAEYHVYYAAQLAGLAAVNNGIFNNYPETGSTNTPYTNEDGTPYGSTKELYNTYKMTDSATASTTVVGDISRITAANSKGSSGANNQVTTSDYWFGGTISGDGVLHHNDFTGKTIYLEDDLNMGGTITRTGTTTSGSGPNYMPIAGQYCMDNASGYTKLSASFNGVFDGQGHIVYNIYCNRYAPNFGDAQSVGLIGRLGVHDNDDKSLYSNNVVRNTAVAGYIYSRRSVGGIVGKSGKSTSNLIENCVNFATIVNTDSKGVGGIVGAGWNSLKIKNCVNFGYIYAGRSNAGGISGSCEAAVYNCYDFGYVGAISKTQGQSLGTNNGGAVWTNCYWLADSSISNQAVYSSTSKDTITMVSTPAEMTKTSFLSSLNGTGRGWVSSSNQTFISPLLSSYLANVSSYGSSLASYDCTGMPLPRAFIKDTAKVSSFSTSGACVSEYISGQSYNAGTLVINAHYSDGTTDTVDAYTVTTETGGDTLSVNDTYVVISGSKDGAAFEYTYPITVTANALSKISVTPPSRTIYCLGETVDTTGMVVKATYTNGDSKEVTDYTVTPSGSLSPSDEKITVKYSFAGETQQAEVGITVLDTAVPALSEDGYYQLYTTNDMVWFGSMISSTVKPDIKGRLMTDINMSKSEWTPCGTYSCRYIGDFDGNGKTVTLALSNTTAAALFGYVGEAGTIHDLIVNGTVSGKYNTAAIACYCYGKITNCTNNADITSQRYYTGGIAGQLSGSGIIENCTNNGKVTATDESYGYGIGGIAGYSTETAAITGAVNTGSITGLYNVGGIVGDFHGTGSISNCMNKGAVKANTVSTTVSNTCAGIAGYLYGASTVDSCKNTGMVTSSGYIAGGIAGMASNLNCKVQNCYNTGSVSSTITTGTPYVGGIVAFIQSASLTVKNNYNVGAVSAAATATYTAAVIGCANGITNVANNYYLTGSAAKGIGKSTDNASSYDAAALKAAAASLGSSFKEGNSYTNAGYPVLSWETLNDTVVPEYILISKAPDKVLYAEGESFDAAGMEVTAFLSDGTSTVVGDCTYSSAALTPSDKKELISYTLNGVAKSAEQRIDVLSAGAPATDQAGAYLLTTAADLNWFAAQINNGITSLCAVVSNDIDASETVFTPIGTYADPYTGVFEGNDHTITINVSGNNFIGLFGSTKDAQIKNVAVAGNVAATSTLVCYVGGIVGLASSTSITDCTNNAVVTSNGSDAGGIAGYAGNTCTITGCINNANVIETNTFSDAAGGIVGFLDNNNTITTCVNYGDVTGGNRAGGIAGYVNTSNTISKAKNSGTVTALYTISGTYGAGGIAGAVLAASNMLDECCNEGLITGAVENVGGIIGFNYMASTAVTNCYNRGTVAGLSVRTSGSAGGIAGKNNSTATFKNCYNAGKVTLNGTDTYVASTTGYIGAFIGYSAKVTNFSNNYYLSGTASAGISGLASGVTDNTVCDDSAALKARATDLGSAYKASNDFTNAGYPVLEWQALNEKSVLEHIAVSAAPTKTEYNENEKFNKDGMEVMAYYSDGTTKAVNSYTYTPSGALLPENTTIYISYVEGNVTKTTQQLITVNKLGNDSSLSALTVTPGRIAFASDSHVYTVDLDNGAAKVKFAATATDTKASVTIRKGLSTPTTVASGTDSLQLLEVGANIFTITVTAENGRDTTDYVMTVNRDKPAESTLSSLTVSEGALSPSFSSTATSYTVGVPNNKESIDFTAVLKDTLATMTIAKDSGTPESILSGTTVRKSLDVGDNVFTVSVTAQNGKAVTGYTVTVTRAQSSESSLTGLSLSNGTLTPAFGSGIYEYTADVDNDVDSTDITAVSADSSATMTIKKDDGVAAGLANNTAATQALIEGSNVFTITVTSQDGTSETPYKLTVNRAKSFAFKDVKSTDWFYTAVEYVFQKNIMTGLKKETFGPNENLERAQFATILYRLAGSPDVTYTSKFSDVPDGMFYSKAVTWASQDSVGIIKGYENGSFGTTDNITREQMMVMMYRYAKYKGISTENAGDISVFPDAGSVSSFAQISMKWAVGSSLITGNGGNIDPQGNANRAQCAMIIMRFLTNLNK